MRRGLYFKSYEQAIYMEFWLFAYCKVESSYIYEKWVTILKRVEDNNGSITTL